MKTEENIVQKYRIRIKNGDAELEVEGDKDFVSKEIRDLKDNMTFVMQQPPTQTITETGTAQITQTPSEATDLETNIYNFANKLGVNPEQIKHIFDFEDEKLTLLISPGDKKVSIKQQKIALAVLTAYKNCYGQEELVVRELNRNIQYVGLSTGNLSTNLKKIKSEIIMKGKAKSTNMAYKLTAPGEQRGIGIIQELISPVQE